MRPLRRKPTYLKIPPFIDENQFSKVLELVKFWASLGFDGVTAANSIPVDEPRVSIKTGGFSGPPLFPNLMKEIKIIRENVPKDFEVNAIGGISNADNVRTALSSGANTVQVYTSLVFEGPGLIKQILNEMQKKQRT
jgi:dihydroorotate dehydrogenase